MIARLLPCVDGPGWVSAISLNSALNGASKAAVSRGASVKMGNAALEVSLTLDEIDSVVGDYFSLKAGYGPP